MDDMMKKMMAKKKKPAKEMSDVEKKAKSSVLEGLRDFAADEMGKKLNGLKKVTVASDSEEGLEKGIVKAQEMLEAHKADGKHPMREMDEEKMRYEAERGPGKGEHEFSGAEHGEPELEEEQEELETADDMMPMDEMEDMSEDDLDRKIEELMKKKARMQK